MSRLQAGRNEASHVVLKPFRQGTCMIHGTYSWLDDPGCPQCRAPITSERAIPRELDTCLTHGAYLRTTELGCPQCNRRPGLALTPLNDDFATFIREQVLDGFLRSVPCPICGHYPGPPHPDHDDAACVAYGVGQPGPRGLFAEPTRPDGWVCGWSGVGPCPICGPRPASADAPVASVNMADARVDIHLHVHVHPELGGATADQVRTIVTESVRGATNEIKEFTMSRTDDLMAAVATLQTGQTKTLTDLGALLANLPGVPQEAIDAVNALVGQNQQIDDMITGATPAAPAAVDAPAADAAPVE